SSLSIVLSATALCDGHWLQTSRGRTFGLWRFCSTEPVETFVGHEPSANLHCITELGQSGVEGVQVGMACCRALVSLAVVAAIFGLEFQVISQVSQGQDSACRWILGSALMLVAASMSVSGVAVFVALLQGFVSPVGLTLTFWCQITAIFFFLLNGMAARYIHVMNTQAPLGGTLQKC
ncbi:voltage-dependent calcium channel gamma-like subunit, partial [Dicentrarchus labrax]